MKYRLLILTDHRIHSPVESIYSIARGLARSPLTAEVHIASRGIAGNEAFFAQVADLPLQATLVDEEFQHNPDGRAYARKRAEVSIMDYDVIFLRLPRVNSMDFFARIGALIPESRIINQPSGIALTGNKEYLLEFPALCPPMQLVATIEEVNAFRAQYQMVLKPLNNSGGKGLLRIDGETVYHGQEQQSWDSYLPTLARDIGQGYLAMKFLENVDQGDKRVIVVNGEVVAAALRVPADGAWLCNVSQGATSVMSEPDADELEMVRQVLPKLQQQGIVMFGMDTLMGDDGKRVLSELNTSCINGIYPAEMHSGKPVVQQTVDLLLAYISSNISLQQ